MDADAAASSLASAGNGSATSTTNEVRDRAGRDAATACDESDSAAIDNRAAANATRRPLRSASIDFNESTDRCTCRASGGPHSTGKRLAVAARFPWYRRSLVRLPSFPAVLSLLVALVLGAVPTHACAPTCGEGGGTVFLGSHAHSGHDRGVCGHEHAALPAAADEHDDYEGVPEGHPASHPCHSEGDACCGEGPGLSASLASRVVMPAGADALASQFAPDARRVDQAFVSMASPSFVLAAGPPDGVSGVVLLR